MPPLLPITLLASLALAVPAVASAAPRIAYESFSGVSTVRSDGTGHRLIVKHADAPSWSPDHTRLAYVLKNAIWTAKADGSDRRRVVALGHGLPFDPAWSPTGDRIAYTQVTEIARPGADDGEVDEAQAVFTVRTDGSGRRAVHAGSAPAWTPSGNHIVLAGDGGLGIVRPDGAGYRRLVRSDDYISDIAVAPNGRRIAYIQALGRPGIGIYDRAKERTRFFGAGDRTAQPDIAWTPDGSRVAWLQHPISSHAGPAPATRLYTAAPDGSARRTLFSFPRGIESPDSLAW